MRIEETKDGKASVWMQEEAEAKSFKSSRLIGEEVKSKTSKDSRLIREEVKLRASKEFDVRFSEVDSMNIVWHGAYPLYFEDAREEFGRIYGLSYQLFRFCECPAPLVELYFRYVKPLLYGQRARVEVAYRNTPAAKIIFDYEIRLTVDDSLVTTGRSTQVFIDKNNDLLLTNPPFYEAWKKKYNL